MHLNHLSPFSKNNSLRITPSKHFYTSSRTVFFQRALFPFLWRFIMLIMFHVFKDRVMPHSIFFSNALVYTFTQKKMERRPTRILDAKNSPSRHLGKVNVRFQRSSTSSINAKKVPAASAQQDYAAQAHPLNMKHYVSSPTFASPKNVQGLFDDQ